MTDEPSGTPQDTPETPPAQPSIMQKDPPADTPPATGPDWLPEDMRSSEGLKKFHQGGVKALAESYLNLEKAFQGKIPGEKATDEERAAFWNPLGRPETPEGYTIKKPDNLPESLQWSEERLKVAAATAHQVGLTNEQFQKMVDFDTQEKINAEADKDAEKIATIAQNTATLKKKWGAGYDEHVTTASIATKTFASDALWDKMEKAGLTSDPLVIELMDAVGQGMREGRRVNGDALPNLTLTPEEAGKEQTAINTDTNHPLHKAYHDAKHPDHEKAVKEVARLGQLKRGRQPVE